MLTLFAILSIISLTFCVEKKPHIIIIVIDDLGELEKGAALFFKKKSK